MLGLGRGAREAVEDEAFHAGVGVEFRSDHAFDHFIGNEKALVDECLGLLAERRPVCDFTAQEVAGRYVTQAEAFDHQGRLGPFARARRAEDQEMFPHCSGGIGVENVDVFVIAAQLVIVQAETHDEAVLDFHGHVVQLEVLFVDFRLEEHRADLHVGGAGVQQKGVEVGDGLARIDDILHYDDGPSLDGRGQAEDLARNARRERPFVGREPDAREFAGEVEPFHQFARKEDRTIEDAQDDGRPVEVLEIVIDAFRYGIDGLFQPLVRDIRYEVPVFDQNPVFHQKLFLILRNYTKSLALAKNDKLY